MVGRDGFLIADPDIGLVLRKTDLSALAHVRAAIAASGDEPAVVSHDLRAAMLRRCAPIARRGMCWSSSRCRRSLPRLNASILWITALLLAGLAVLGAGRAGWRAA